MEKTLDECLEEIDRWKEKASAQRLGETEAERLERDRQASEWLRRELKKLAGRKKVRS